MKKCIWLISITISFCQFSIGQKLRGKSKLHIGQEIKLYAFQGIEDSVYDFDTIDINGNFSLSIPQNYTGSGLIVTENNDSFHLILNKQDVELKINNDKLEIYKNDENNYYSNYLDYSLKSERLNSAWNFLLKEYKSSSNKKQLKLVKKQLKKLSIANKRQLSLIPENSIALKFLTIQKLIQSAPQRLNQDVSSLEDLLQTFWSIDYNNDTIYRSSFYKKSIEIQYWLLENSGLSNDSMFIKINKSTDYILNSIKNDEEKYNSTTNFIFDLLEKRSLFQASEYLALQVLNSNSCHLEEKLTNQLEYYRKMKVGNTAPELILEGGTVKNGKQINKRLNIRELKSEYKMIIFGASWCPKCSEELKKVSSFYENWQLKNVEVVFVALENEIEEYVNFVKPFPWISSSTFKGWEAKAAKDFHIHSTPTLLILDKENKILKKPISIEHANAWINYEL